MKKLFALIILLLLPVSVSAHSGRTDSNGGHKDGSDYHYHHGYPAHDHYDMDGDGDLDCPYDFDDRTGSNSGVSSKNKNTTTKTGSKNEKSSEKSEGTIVYWIIIGIAAIAIIVLILVIKSLKIQLCEQDRKHRIELDSVSKNLTALDKILTAKHGVSYLEEVLEIPDGTIMLPDGFPSSIDTSEKAPWGEEYTVYLGSRFRNYAKYHRLSCRHSCGDMPVHIVAAKAHNLTPCGVCHPQSPDLTWVYEYRKIKKFMDSYVISE